MTADKNHEGFLNIPLPDNTSKLYKLVGLADKPLALAELAIHIKSRLPQQETISISNWIPKPQKLDVICESATNEQVITIVGDNSIELASGETKTYNFSVHCLKDGTYPIKVTFSNPFTGEYVWYSINCKAQLSEPEVITIATAVRMKAHKTIMLKNPFETPITMNFICTANEITIPQSLMLLSRYYL